MLDRFDDLRGHEVHGIVDATENLQGIQEHRADCTEQRGGFSGDDAAVRELDRCGRVAGQRRLLLGRGNHRAIVRGDIGLLHQKLELINDGLCAVSLAEIAKRRVVAADDLEAGGIAAVLVVFDAVTSHVDAHVGRGLVRALTVDALEHRVQDREDLDITVIVDRGLAIGLEVIRVDHVDVVEVGGRCLVGEVNRMAQRDVPDREGLELRVAGLDAMLILLVELAQADGHLSGTRARCGHDHEGTRRLDVVVLAEALIADDKRYIARIARNRVMTVDLDAEGLKLLLVSDRTLLPIEAGEHDGAHIEAIAAERIDETQNIHIVGDAEIPTDLVLLDVAGIDDDHDLRVILQLT